MQVNVEKYGGNRSEVARCLQQIDDEYNSAQLGLNGMAVVSRHDFITRKMERISVIHEQLRALVGDEEALTLVVQAVNAVNIQKNTSEPV